MTSHQFAHRIAKYLQDKQAEDVLVLDLRDLSTIADYFVIATGSVDVHVKALVDHVDLSMRTGNPPARPSHLEGYSNLYWVLMDYGVVIVHILQPQAREYYKLEKLWGDAPTEVISSISDTENN